jgi:hypothetical protein
MKVAGGVKTGACDIEVGGMGVALFFVGDFWKYIILPEGSGSNVRSSA